MSIETQELLNICEQLPEAMRVELTDFARFLLAKNEDATPVQITERWLATARGAAKPDDVLFINASEGFVKGKRQNQLTEAHIDKIIATYQNRPQNVERYARRVEMKEIKANDFNLNISRYISTAQDEVEIDLPALMPSW